MDGPGDAIQSERWALDVAWAMRYGTYDFFEMAVDSEESCTNVSKKPPDFLLGLNTPSKGFANVMGEPKSGKHGIGECECGLFHIVSRAFLLSFPLRYISA